LILAAMPCFGQRPTKIIVEKTQAVQVSTGDNSPNVSNATSVTIYYCSNVTYCGPSSAPASGNYAYTSASSPLWTTLPSLHPAVYVPENITSASSTGLLSISNGVLTTSSDPFSTSVPALPGATDVSRMLSAMTGQPIAIGIQSGVSWSRSAPEGNLAISTANPSSLAASSYDGQINLASALVSGSNSLPLNEPSWMRASSTLGSTSSLATIVGSSSPAITSYASGNIDIGHLILTANSSMTPMSSAMPTTAIGGMPLAAPDFPAGLVTGVFSTSIGGLSGVSGTNSESLAQQLENIKASGARIVSWSVLYDSSPVQNN
jgi:hypothetical protein